MLRSALFLFAPVFAVLVLAPGCDHGLAPPDVVPPGSIVGTIAYVGSWPPADSVQDLRFVAMRFVPRDTTDFLQLNKMAISEPLAYGVVADSFRIDGVDPGVFWYSGVAQQFDENILSWRPVGLYEDEGGVFVVESNQDTRLHVTVDFGRLPVFPPPGLDGAP